jgi:hypothetical protein
LRSKRAIICCRMVWERTLRRSNTRKSKLPKYVRGWFRSAIAKLRAP